MSNIEFEAGGSWEPIKNRERMITFTSLLADAVDCDVHYGYGISAEETRAAQQAGTCPRPPATQHYSRRIRRTVSWYRRVLSEHRTSAAVGGRRFCEAEIRGLKGHHRASEQHWGMRPAPVDREGCREIDLTGQTEDRYAKPIESMKFGLFQGGLNIAQFLHCRQLGQF